MVQLSCESAVLCSPTSVSPHGDRDSIGSSWGAPQLPAALLRALSAASEPLGDPVLLQEGLQRKWWLVWHKNHRLEAVTVSLLYYGQL